MLRLSSRVHRREPARANNGQGMMRECSSSPLWTRYAYSLADDAGLDSSLPFNAVNICLQNGVTRLEVCRVICVRSPQMYDSRLYADARS